jgi:hypothetical protein
VKQEKDPLALWGGSLGPSGRGAVTFRSINRMELSKIAVSVRFFLSWRFLY